MPAPIRTCSTYTLPISDDDFKRIQDREDREDSHSHKKAPSPTIRQSVNAIEGVDDCDYNGHFGSFIHYRVTAEADTPETHAAVAALVDLYAHPRKK